MSSFNDELLYEFMTNFYGYGTYTGKTWFIGMEEGGGNSFEEIQNRLTVWEQMASLELLDIQSFHEKIEMNHWFGSTAKLQTTWNKAIRVFLSSQGINPTSEMVRTYQSEQFARVNSETCILELLPLPSPSIKDWIYAHHSSLKILQNRQTYMEEVTSIRVPYIRDKISLFRPRQVVFFGLDSRYQLHWKDIANVTFKYLTSGSYSYLIADSKDTRFAISSHPAAKGITNDYFYQLGQVLAA